MNDEELFNSAMTEAAPEIEAPAEPERTRWTAA